MGQSKIGPYNQDRSYLNVSRQYTFGDAKNYEGVHKALNFSNIHLSIHDGLFINGYFLSNCKFTISSEYSLKEIKQLLLKENKMMLFQHEFERISQDIRFKNSQYKQKTEIQEVSISDLYREINVMDSFGTQNSVALQLKKRQSRPLNQSSDEDFTDMEDNSRSPTPPPRPENKYKSSLIIKKNFPSDSESGIEQKLEDEISGFNKMIRDKHLITEPSFVNHNSEEEQLVNQVSSDISNLRQRIEQHIGPSYKESNENQFTTNYQRLLKQQNQSNVSNVSNHSSNQQKSLLQQQQEILQKQQQPPPKPEQIKSISIQVNNNNKKPSTPIYKPIVSSKYQYSPETSHSSVYKPPWGQKQASILSSEDSEQRVIPKTKQPINIKIDFNQRPKK